MMLKNMTICEVTDIYEYAVKEHGQDWNNFQDLIYRSEEHIHRHFHLNTFVVTMNFFNEKYMDDAYGLQWHPIVQEVVKGFMKLHRLRKLVIVTCKNHSLGVL